MLESIKQWISALESGEISARESVNLSLKRIKDTDSQINSFLSLQAEEALARADKIDQARAKNEPVGNLAGLPIALKDLICQKDIECRCASHILEGYRPPYDATVVKNLEDAGAIVIGRVNMDEFAMGSSTENSAFQTTHNPWNTDYVPGGSSGGSAAAVAARQVPLAIGSDTGGSIRQPASFCGITGLKPTYGRVSRYGLCAYASSLDQIGTLALDVEDTAIVMQEMAGYDKHDTTSANIATPKYSDLLNGNIKGLKIGVPKEYFIDGIDAATQNHIQAAIAKLVELGAEVKEVSLPHTEYAIATYYIIATAEASSNLARYDGIHYGRRAADTQSLADVYTKTRREFFGDEVLRRIILGSYVLSSGYYDAYYLKAQKVRTLIKQDFENVFKEVDIIAAPTAPSSAWKVGSMSQNPLEMYLSDIYTVSVNLAGIPGLSIPCGFSESGLPIGLQLLAQPFAEERLLNTGFAYQQATDFHKQRPACSAIKP